MTRLRFPTMLAASLLTLAFVPQAQTEEPRTAYEEFGRAFAERSCADGTICPLEDVIAQHYKLARVGAFDVLYPEAGLEDAKEAKLFASALIGLFEAQGALVDWIAEEPSIARDYQDDVALVTKWISKWKPKALKTAASADEADLFAALGVEADLDDAIARMSAVFDDAEGRLGIRPKHPRRPRLFLCPTRRDFVEAVGFMGLSDSRQREEFWKDGVEEWTYLWWGWTVFLALEYSPWTGFDPEFRTGKPMNELSKSGLVEHTNQQALKVLFYHWFGREDPRHEEKGLAINLAIAVSGSANTLDGEGKITTSGATTAPYSRFVPGGNPNGGILPAVSAAPFDSVVASQWRKGDGEDYFIEPLRRGQKEGAKVASKDKENPRAKDPLPHFVLKSAEGAKHLASAPFFGDAASEQQYPPTEFLNDFREFYRSYQTCFLYWLRTHGAGNADKSRDAFRRLIRGMDELSSERNFEDLLEEIYGVPISGRDESMDSLEWRFLGWLPKGRASR